MVAARDRHGLTARALAFLLPAILGSAWRAEARGGLSTQIMGSEFTYTVERADSLTSVGARFGVEIAAIVSANGLTRRAPLVPGQTLRIDARHLAAADLPEWGIVVNLPQRFLFYADGGKPVFAFPVAVGRPGWKTPTGRFRIATKELHPVWVVPASIQAEMRREGKTVLKRVEPGPENPLGDYWMGLSESGCGIHATNAPASIYGFRTHGCIRLHPDDARRLFERAAVGLPVQVIYQPLLLAKTEDGELWLEVHRDPYRGARDPGSVLKALAATAGVGGDIDWTLAGGVIAKKEGSPRRIDRRAGSETSGMGTR